jgi:hypothetical protein
MDIRQQQNYLFDKRGDTVKKPKIVTLLFAFLVFFLAGTAHAQVRLGFRFSGGLSYLSGGDLNEGAEGWSEYYRLDELHDYSQAGEFKPIHVGFDFGGDLILKFSPRIGIGVGSGYITASKSFSIAYTHTGWDPFAYTSRTNIGAVPLRLSLYCFFPLGPTFQITFHLGGGYYLANLKLNIRAEDPTYFEAYDFKASGGGLGLHGGLGLEVALSPAVSLVLDLTGRWAVISNFKGDFIVSNTWSYGLTPKADLYFFKAMDPPFGTFPLLFMSSAEPSGPAYSDVRRARVDFSGLTSVIGFVFKF